MALVVEPEVMLARRAWPTAQQLLAGPVERRLPGRRDVGWYDTSTHPETGAFAVVRPGSDLEVLAGEVLAVTVDRRQVFVYVVGIRSVPTDLALARRAFLALAPLSAESRRGVVEVV